MKIWLLVILSIFSFSLSIKQLQYALSTNYKYDRLTTDNTVIILVDHQVGLLNGVRTISLEKLKNNVLALAQIAKLYSIPVVLSTSAETGPNGPMLPELTQILSNVSVIKRNGEINAWDNTEFKNTVKSLNRKKLVIAGISTDVCLAFVALSAVSDGYDAYAVMDASGTWDKRIEFTAAQRMTLAGVQLMSWFAVTAEL